MVQLRNNFGAPLFFQFAASQSSLTVSNGQFQMKLNGPSGRSVIVETSTNLQTWTPVQTNTFTPDGLALSVPLGGNQNHFFRAQSAQVP